MKILHINIWDRVGGGARAMYRLHDGLRRLGHQSELLVGRQTISEPAVSCISQDVRPLQTFGDRALERIGAPLARYFGVDDWSYRSSWLLAETSAFRRADVLNLHCLHGNYFNFRALPALAKLKPTVWTLHDMWPLTGHCAFSYDCERWRTGCHTCPLLNGHGRSIVEPSPVLLDRTRSIWEAKRRVYQRTPLHIVTPSRWLYDLVRQSILAGSASVRQISYGIDLDVFRPLDQSTARRALDLPVDEPVIFFSAVNVMNARKGFSFLLEALDRLSNDTRGWLLTAGGHADLGQSSKQFQVRQLDFLGDDRLQRLAFAAADLFVFPTLADNQPLVVMEALACGTPVVTFNVGGVTEMVDHLETGYLARYKDADDLAHGVQLLLTDDALRARMRRRCREVAEAEYPLELQARRYLELYSEVLGLTDAMSNAE